MRQRIIQFAGQEITSLASSAILIRVIGVALVFFSHALFANVLDTEGYGQFALAFAIATILSAVCMRGFDISAQRFIPNYIVNEENTKIYDFERFSLAQITKWSLVSGLFLAIFTLVFSKDWSYSLIFFIAATMVVVNCFAQLYSAILRAYKKIFQALAPVYILKPSILILAGVLMILVPSVASTANAMIAALISSFLCLFVCYRSHKSSVSNEQNLEKPTVDPDWTRVSAPLYVASLIVFLQTQIDIVLVGFFMNNDDVGIYSMASKVAALAWLGSFSISSVAGAPIREKLSSGDPKKNLHALFRTVSIGQILFVLPVSLALIYGADPILNILGSAYLEGTAVLVILVITYGLTALFSPAGVFMGVADHEKAAMWIALIWLLLQIVLAVILIPFFGIIGAAISTALCFGGRIISNFLYVWLKLGIDCSVFSLIRSR